ncbi:hypothetical protein K438DRAFT_1775599 [Mycena galopus ATCC 62051]|nr:hypothetical protein K438DRAFT_1775599 [Mycena galopus ATCC 62051]
MLASRDYGDMFNIHSPPTVIAKTESKAGDSLSPTGKILPSPPSTKRASAVPSSSTLKMTTLSAGKCTSGYPQPGLIRGMLALGVSHLRRPVSMVLFHGLDASKHGWTHPQNGPGYVQRCVM